MKVRSAIEEILKKVGKPLHLNEITKMVVSSGLWIPETKTPEATIAATIYEDIKKKGAESSFVKTAPATFTLQSARGKTAKAAMAKEVLAKSLSFTDAAEKVLETLGNGNPMHYSDITKAAIGNAWLKTEGKTPDASMYAQIHMEIERYTKRGKQCRFVKLGRGMFGLSRWGKKGLTAEIEKHNQRVLETLRKQLMEMNSGEFEELVGRLFGEIGFQEVEITNRYKDGGIDVRGTLIVGEAIKTKMAVQVKRWKQNVQAPVVQQVRGSLGAHEQGLIVTTSDFSKGARTEAERADATPVGLMNGEQLVALMAEYNLGVTRRSHDILDLGEESGPERD